MKTKNLNLQIGEFNLNVRKSLSPLFSLAKIYVMHTGVNPNGSRITKEAVERNLDSLRNIPIVGEYVREDNNFTSHGGELTIEDDTIRFLQTTHPIGVVPSEAEFMWEMVTDSEGIEREYLVVNNAYIWNRDEKMVQALKNDAFGQSMEIGVTEGETLEDGYFDIVNFYFTALCVLGIDRNGAGYVQPAFDNANIQTYSFDKSDEEFAVSLRDMFKDFQFALNDINKVKEDETLKTLESLLEQYSITVEDVSAKVENYSELPIEDLASLLEKEFGEPEDKTDNEEDEQVEPDAETETEENAEETETETEPTDKEEEPKDKPNEDEKDTEEDVEEDEPQDEGRIEEYQARIAELEEENESLKNRVESLQGDVQAYEKAEHERVCEEKINEFVAVYNLDENLVENLDVHKFENTDALESKLFELVGRMAKPSHGKADKFEKINIQNDKKDKTNSYGFAELFTK